MSSPSLSPTAEAPASLHLLPSPTHASAHLDHQLQSPAPPPGSGLYLTFHRAGLMSLHSVLGLASWFRTSVIPRITSLVLRAFRAALYLLTSSIPVLTSLVSVEIDRIEVYVQEAEAVARIGRAGLTFSLSPGSATEADRSKSASNEDAATDRTSPSSFFDAMRMMPTRMGSGARGVASYLVAGMSPSYVKAHIRVDSIELFEANFKPSTKSNPNSRVSSRRNSDAASSRSPARATSPSYAESGPFSPSQSDAAMDTTQDDPSLPVDDSIDSGYRPRGPPRRRSNSASRLSRMSSTSLRGFADRWADWALEPLVDSDFHADSGWTRKHLSDDFPSDKVHTIPTSARILSINGVTELTASILMGSNLALGGDKTLSAKLTLGAAILRLDAAYRALRVVEGRKSHGTNFANAPGGDQKGTHPPHPRHPRPPGMRHSSPAATALHMISSLSLSLPSVRVMASSETMLLAAAPHTEGMGQDSSAASSPPARQFAVNLAGFSVDLKHSDPRDPIHRRWLGTCGLAKKKSAGRSNRSKKPSANDKSSDLVAASPFGSVAIDHRRVFLVDISLASLEVHCREHARSQGSRLLFVGDLSVESRSSWTPFGLLATCPESARMLLSGDPNEHVAAVETSVGGVESNVTLEDITALIQIANEVHRQRHAMRSASASDKPRRPRAGGKGTNARVAAAQTISSGQTAGHSAAPIDTRRHVQDRQGSAARIHPQVFHGRRDQVQPALSVRDMPGRRCRRALPLAEFSGELSQGPLCATGISNSPVLTIPRHFAASFAGHAQLRAVTETKTNASTLKTNWGARTALELSEDLQLQAVSLATRHGRVGLARVVLHEAGFFPILDASLATQQHTEGTASEPFARAKAPAGLAAKETPDGETLDRPATSLLAEGVWNFDKSDERVHQSTQHRPRFRQQDRSNFIFFLPYAAVKAVVRPPHAENKAGLAGTSEDEVFITTENTNLLAFKIDILHTYCILLALATFKDLAQSARRPDGGLGTNQEGTPAHAPARHHRPSISYRFDIKEVHTFVTLPRAVRIFIRVRRLEVRSNPQDGLAVSIETAMGAVESPKQIKGDAWEEAVRLRDWKVMLPPKRSDGKLQIKVNGDAALIRIPYGYAVNPIIDNMSVAIKATKQIVHQFLKSQDDSIITPYAEEPKLLPDIDINIRVLTLEAQDDPFETKLNLIWRAGLAENSARDERESAFAAKAEELGATKMPHSSTSFRSGRSNVSLGSSIASADSDSEDVSSFTSHDTRFTASKQQHVSYEEARMALDAFNSSSWVRALPRRSVARLHPRKGRWNAEGHAVFAAATGRPDAVEYGIVIPKVAMPVKMYGTPTVRLRTPFPTRLVWGQSIQPTIQDVMRVIDGITPPPHDPSPKLGFWDKLSLILHGHLNIKLEDEGGFNIHLKGGRDPYGIQGQDAGWVKSWKGGVEIRIGYDNPQKEVFQILSHEYVLAVPDLTDYVDHAATGILGGDQHGNSQQSSRDGDESYHDSYDRKSLGASFTSSMHRYMKDPTFRKIVIKLTNGVRWGAGLHGERTCDDETCPRRPKCKGEPFYRECRIFERIDHWKVVTKTREYFDSLPEDERRDSYRGWRSHHLHFSLSVFSPKNGISGYGGQQSHASRLDAVNNFYFTPLAWAHFWAWMRLFNSAMSLPIRTGQLFPESPPPSPKFGRFLGTIKYRIDLEPLFITHQYRQFNKEDWARGDQGSVAQDPHVPGHEVSAVQLLSQGGFEARKVDSKRERRAKETQDRAANGKRSREQGSDLEELLSKLERSKFGGEKSHVCMVGQNDKPYGVQRKIAQDRLKTIRSEIDRVLNSSDDGSAESESHSEGVEDQQERLNELHGRERILSGFIAHLGRLQEDTDRIERAKADGTPAPKRSGTINRNFTLNATDLASLYRDLGMFDNRYIAHNPTLFFSNTTRTLLLKYYYSSRLRRGYAHHMTATAVRYIRDLLKKKDKAGRPSAMKMNDYLDAGRSTQHLTPSTEGANGLDILHEMLDDMINHMRGKDGYSKSGWGTRNEGEEDEGLEAGMRPTDGISDDFNVAKSNVCVLLKPQIVLRSDVDDNSTVIVSALRTRLQNYTVQDESCAEDSVNATVLRRNFFALDSLQCWHPNARSNSTYVVEARAERHGFVALPLEALVDMHGQCRDFERIVPHTNASMYYDKFNKLRLSDSSRSVSTFRKDGKPVQDHLHHHMDMILLNCPRFSVSADSEHFAALYNVVTDLILYRDPAHRDHAKRLEEMMFSYDFTDVSGLADIVTALQVRIREAQTLIEQYRAVADRLNERGRADYVAVLRDALELITELNLIMEAITTSQDSKGGADREKKSALRFMTQAQEVAWNMIGDEAGELVTKLALRGISFSWLNKADNSAANTLAIQDLQALSVDPNAMFAEIIAKYLRAPDHPMAKEGRFLDAMWSVLPPVGGISIVDMFEFNLHPVKIQIELVVGRKIMDYVFGTKRQREKQEEEQRRLEDQTRRQEKAIAKKKSPLARLLGGRKNLTGSASSQTSRRPSTNASSRNASTVDLASRNASSTDLLSVGRPSSDGSREDDADSVSGRTRVATGGASTGTAKASLKSRPGTPASGKDAGSDDERRGDQFAIAQRNAAEMRSRASAYRTFVYVKISQTIFCLSYKGEKEKSITDLYDLVFRTPNFEYHNSTFGYVDLADTFKKDVFKAAWNQKSTLLRDIITHRPNRKRNAIESIRAIRQASKARESLAPLDIAVEPPTPAGRSSFDGSSHLVESPTDTFSYRGGEAYGDDGQSIDSQALEADGDGDGSRSEEVLQRPEHVRQGTGQTLAGQIRDEWGRNNELEAAAHASTPSLASSDERRDSVGEVDAMLHLHTPRRESADPEPGRRFPGLRRLSFGGDSPATERGEALSMASASSSPYLQLPPGAASRRASLASSRSHSPSFKLNKLLPRSLRRRASTSAPGRNGTSPADEEQHMQRATSSDYSASIRSTH
ncbi:hypothetical protein L1887_61488 [Cichorium endivia]|nr:hypothetical protein L1887_61488 [Cichorium endivia]